MRKSRIGELFPVIERKEVEEYFKRILGIDRDMDIVPEKFRDEMWIDKQEDDVPSEYRRYVSLEDLVRLSKEVKVYADERGRLYIDVRELRE